MARDNTPFAIRHSLDSTTSLSLRRQYDMQVSFSLGHVGGTVMIQRGSSHTQGEKSVLTASLDPSLFRLSEFLTVC